MYGTVEKEGVDASADMTCCKAVTSHTISYAREKTKKGSDLRVPMPVDIEGG